MSSVADKPMARKKTGGGESPGGKPTLTTTKVDADLLRKARMVAIHRNIDLFDYVAAILRPVVERDYDKMIEAESKR
jgi:hypothetical protein